MATHKVTQKIIEVASISDMGALAIQVLNQETQATKNPVTDLTGYGPNVRPLIEVSKWTENYNSKHPEQALNFSAEESPEIKQARAFAETAPAEPEIAEKPEVPAKPEIGTPRLE